MLRAKAQLEAWGIACTDLARWTGRPELVGFVFSGEDEKTLPDGLRAADYYGYSKWDPRGINHKFGIHIRICEVVEGSGGMLEWHDAGTVTASWCE